MLFLTLQACGGRIPSTQRAQNIIKSHFNHYGKKYPETPFGGHKVQQIQILNLEEIQRHLSYGSALLTLDNGAVFKINMNFLYKSPFGWRQQGWELVSKSNSDS